ncbi:MAG: PilZ domain-containing protein [Gammaproteobacteria bacterium]|nr:PilZ domain-containing protein [Gammaproteobacteria bacterium]
MHKERRQVTRYDIELDIDLVLESSAILPVKTLDISQQGLQFACDGLAANEIEPRGIQCHPLDHLKVKVIANLPVGEKKKKFYASCKVIAARRLSQEEYLIGLEFFDFEKNSEKVLSDYISQLPDSALK